MANQDTHQTAVTTKDKDVEGMANMDIFKRCVQPREWTRWTKVGFSQGSGRESDDGIAPLLNTQVVKPNPYKAGIQLNLRIGGKLLTVEPMYSTTTEKTLMCCACCLPVTAFLKSR